MRTQALQGALVEGRIALRIPDACTALGVGRSTLYELMDSGQLKSIKLGGRRLIPVECLAELVKRQLDS